MTRLLSSPQLYKPSRRQFLIHSGFLLTSLCLGFGCSDETNTPQTGDTEELLIKLNADLNQNRTIRFPDGPIQVCVENVPDGRNQVRTWSEALKDIFEFQFVDSSPSQGITIRYGIQAPIICGVTYEPNWKDGIIKSAVIELDPKVLVPVLGGCNQTVTHEVGHALGMLGHIGDGHLMDSDGGDGQISDQILEFFSILYSYPPNTLVADIFG